MSKPNKPTAPATPATEHAFASQEILKTLHAAAEAARDSDGAALAATLAEIAIAFTAFSEATAPTDAADALQSYPVEDLINELTRRVHDEGSGTPYALMIHELAHARIVDPAMAPILAKACGHYAIDAKRKRNAQRDAEIESDVATAADDIAGAPSMEDGWNR